MVLEIVRFDRRQENQQATFQSVISGDYPLSSIIEKCFDFNLKKTSNKVSASNVNMSLDSVDIVTGERQFYHRLK